MLMWHILLVCKFQEDGSTSGSWSKVGFNFLSHHWYFCGNRSTTRLLCTRIDILSMALLVGANYISVLIKLNDFLSLTILVRGLGLLARPQTLFR